MQLHAFSYCCIDCEIFLFNYIIPIKNFNRCIIMDEYFVIIYLVFMRTLLCPLLCTFYKTQLSNSFAKYF